MRKHFWTTLFLLVIGFMPITIFADKIQLKKMEVHDLSHHWQFVFYLSKPTQFRSFNLDNPNRFVLDLKNVHANIRLRYKPLFGTPINALRYSYHKDHIFRVVFDLDMPVKAKLVELPTNKTGERKLQVMFIKKAHHVSGFGLPDMKSNASGDNLKSKSPSLLREHANKTDQIAETEKKKQAFRNIVIVIDPGHGGKDPGATGKGGTHEKNVVLAISKKLQKLIDQQPGFSAVLTRKSDYYIPLRRRLLLARKYKADMFVAIHADAWKNDSARGAAVYALSRRGATSEAARWLARRENKSELMGGVELQDKSHLLKSVLINLSQTATIRASLRIGENLLSAIKHFARLHHDRVEQAAFVVLKSPDIPSLLVETGFLSNPYEERRLRNPQYQAMLAKAIMQGIREYYSSHPPRYSWLAKWRKYPKYHAQKTSKQTVVIKRGDTLSRIADEYGIALSRLKAENNLKSNHIYVGQKLVISSKG